MCHLDDDNYLNYPALIKYLKQYNATFDHFIGYGSIKWPIYTNKESKTKAVTKQTLGRKGIAITLGVPTTEEQKMAGLVQVSYATGGAGWCLSRALIERGIHLFDNFVNECRDLDMPDELLWDTLSKKSSGCKWFWNENFILILTGNTLLPKTRH